MQINNKVMFILNSLNKNGFDSYLVGGFVRDNIMNIPSNDVDITTAATPYEIKKIFPNTYDTGIKHGTITVVIESERFEITTFRIDGQYTDKRRPDSISFTKNIHKDLSRRDFTINAIAYNPQFGFIDPFNGISDINKKVIRAVGDPDKRFNEDALRLFRALRFCAQLNFNIDNTTYRSIKKNAKLISIISIERIRDELFKLLLKGKSKNLLNELIDTKLLEYAYKPLCYILSPRIQYLNEGLSIISKDLILILSFLLMGHNKDGIKSFLKFFKIDNASYKRILIVTSNINIQLSTDSYILKKALKNLGELTLRNILYLKSILAKLNKDEIFVSELMNISSALDMTLSLRHPINIQDLDINGHDLIKLGVKRGKSIATMLEILLDVVLRQPDLNNYKSLADIVIKSNQFIRKDDL